MSEPFEVPDLAELPDLPSPVLSLAAHDDDLWVGGLGGVGSLRQERRRPEGPLTSVAAMAFSGTVLVAGGSEGIARRPRRAAAPAVDDAHKDWEMSEAGVSAPVAGLLTAGDDGLLLAATLGDGVLRSADHGSTWEPSNSGLTATEVCSLAVHHGPDGPEILAATTEGVFAGADGARAWRACSGTEGTCVADVAYTVDGTPFAVTEDGRVLSPGDGDDWRFAGMVLGTATAMTALPDGTLLVGTGDTGIWFSRDQGKSWRQADGFADVRSVYCLLAHAGQAYAGTGRGLAVASDGRAWQATQAPPTHDFSHALDWRERRLVIGRLSGLAHQAPDGGWEQLSTPTLPLTCVAVTPDDSLLASGPSGLFRYQGHEDGQEGEEWEPVVPGDDGLVGRMTFRADGTGLAARPDHGESLMRTRDHGRTWERLDAPFGALAPVTLHAFEKTVMVQTVEPATDTLTVWGSRDDGTSWEQVWQGPNKPVTMV